MNKRKSAYVTSGVLSLFSFLYATGLRGFANELATVNNTVYAFEYAAYAMMVILFIHGIRILCMLAGFAKKEENMDQYAALFFPYSAMTYTLTIMIPKNWISAGVAPALLYVAWIAHYWIKVRKG